MGNCNISIKDISSGNCGNIKREKKVITVIENKCWINNKYHGKVLSIVNDTVKVKVNNGNKYMKGQIDTFLIKNN